MDYNRLVNEERNRLDIERRKQAQLFMSEEERSKFNVYKQCPYGRSVKWFYIACEHPARKQAVLDAGGSSHSSNRICLEGNCPFLFPEDLS